MRLSVVIPACNEAEALPETLSRLLSTLQAAGVDHELVVVNDHSTDDSAAVLSRLQGMIPTLRVVTNDGPRGFGCAVRVGLSEATGDAVAVFMADLSDDPADLVRFLQVFETEKVDCVFGSRFSPGGKTIDYPWLKYILNRAGNLCIRWLFGLSYNDTTNAFKLYSRQTLKGLEPLLSYHFNLTVELPLKAIIRGYRYAVVPNSWTNRKTGESKLKIKEMGSRYFFIIFYCLLEKWLSRGDYRRPPSAR